MMNQFLFSTGIENSNPTVNNGRVRVDEMEKCGHYKYWRKDFDLVEEMGIRFLRYGPPLHTTWLGVDNYDWSFADETLHDLQRRNISVIIDLCHFGLPDWLGNFQNPEFPELFAGYARAFALRFPWVQFYTPVNEMYICAKFSALLGWWNEQLQSDHGFVTALKYLVKANVLAMHGILNIRPAAMFIQSESSEFHHADNLQAVKSAEVLNYKRFLSLDLNYGHRVDSGMYEFLMDNGMTRDEYHFFLKNKVKQRCIMGNDYYNTNEHRVAADGSLQPAGETFGYYVITEQYYKRYYLPIMHTETNFAQGPNGNEAVLWLWKQWTNVLRIRYDGVPIIGFTWYSLTDQVDWDTALRENNGRVNPLGLYDLNRNIRPVGEAYKKIINDWRWVLPAQRLFTQEIIEMPADVTNNPYSKQP